MQTFLSFLVKKPEGQSFFFGKRVKLTRFLRKPGYYPGKSGQHGIHGPGDGDPGRSMESGSPRHVLRAISSCI